MTNYIVDSVAKDKSMFEKYAKFSLKFINNEPDLGLAIIHEILDAEKILGKRDIYLNLSKALNKLQPGITSNLLKEVTSV